MKVVINDLMIKNYKLIWKMIHLNVLILNSFSTLINHLMNSISYFPGNRCNICLGQ